ncbi:SEC-C metal-binding domain-containing protein [Sphingomonas sp. PP-CC-3G-468]|uniref:SEC-C metal-binding domain-containing protein n=1 Tax=Sphingomonas sp. PP-CC-3G-468 TaxID=2135656 RepID=UPI0010F32D1B|nr:SEC-C metal-binding domain-containing protein [Sphingomonas sp. PP-CC-3G-468]TCM07448.1 methyltransferase family protein [Sphingomonas sp. PP-CC-3G-468]
MRFEPNAPCPCGSGRKYKKCHRNLEEAAPHQRYAAAQEVYATSWKETAALQYARGDYAWMADQLPPMQAARLLDVGTGSGHGLLALRERLGADLRIVGVDENLSCLKHAAHTLATAGCPADVIARLDTRETPSGFVQQGADIPIPLPEPIALIEADPLTDEHLEQALLDGGRFDVVTIWLTGAHSWRRHNA